MSMNRRQAIQLIAGAVPAVRAFASTPQAATPRAAVAPQAAAVSSVEGVKKFVFDGISSEMMISMKELGQPAPADLSAYSHLVMEMRMSSPQRPYLWAYTAHGPRSVSIIGFGQNAWLRASIPLQYFIGRDSNGNDLASAQNRRTDCAGTLFGGHWEISKV